jgi:hypothetical protein
MTLVICNRIRVSMPSGGGGRDGWPHVMGLV